MNSSGQPKPSLPPELVATYVRGLPQRLEQLRNAVSQGDFDTAARIGHQLKGSGRSYGFPELTELGAQIEEAGRYFLIQRLRALECELAREFTRISTSIQPLESV